MDPPSIYFDNELKQAVYDSAVSQFLTKIRGQLDLSVSLAEASQTKSMFSKYLTRKGIASIAKDILGVTKDVRRGKILNSKQASLAANAWLEYTYGWKPLASDIYNALDELQNHHLRKNINNVDVRVTRKKRDVFAQSYGVTPGLEHLHSVNGFYSCTISGFIEPSIPIQSVSTWTSLNPANIAWELLPYSFVVDWFYDIGSYLRDMESYFLYNSSITRVSQSQLSVVSDFATCYAQAETGNGDEKRIVSANASATYIDFNRSVGLQAPNAPSLKLNLGSNQILSAASLLWQLLGEPTSLRYK